MLHMIHTMAEYGWCRGVRYLKTFVRDYQRLTKINKGLTPTLFENNTRVSSHPEG